MKYVILSILLFTSCRSKEEQRELNNNSLYSDMYTIKYIQDKRTNLCFATNGLYSYSAVLTHIPCENIPQHLLLKDL